MKLKAELEVFNTHGESNYIFICKLALHAQCNKDGQFISTNSKLIKFQANLLFNSSKIFNRYKLTTTSSKLITKVNLMD